MIVRTLSEIVGSEREVSAPGWTSHRLLLRGDGTDFSLHDTRIHPGADLTMHYPHHLEAVYCIEGHGILQDLDSGETWTIEPGVLYTLDGHERHRLQSDRGLRVICVFTPALTGRETHGPDGAYPPAREAEKPVEAGSPA